jgi:integrase
MSVTDGERMGLLQRRGIGPAAWTAHWFRHSHASALLQADTPDWVVSRRLAHAHVHTVHPGEAAQTGRSLPSR